jgi:hypothetical protein
MFGAAVSTIRAEMDKGYKGHVHARKRGVTRCRGRLRTAITSRSVTRRNPAGTGSRRKKHQHPSGVTFMLFWSTL